MKHVVSISLGSSTRDKRLETEILGHRVLVERIGTDGDQKLARQKYLELDGQVDCFGIGGCELGVPIGKKYYKIHAVQKLVRGLKTPAVDGLGVRTVVEGKIARWIDVHLDDDLSSKKVMLCVAAGRYHMLESFRQHGCSLMICDAGFLLGIPLYTRSLNVGLFFATIYGPLISRLPFSILYPTGHKQVSNRPRFQKWFDQADIIADDFHYIRRNMPTDLKQKIIVTNTTTETDLELLADRNASAVCTTTPRIQGRSFGTNVVEAMLTAVAECDGPMPVEKMEKLVREARIEPALTNF